MNFLVWFMAGVCFMGAPLYGMDNLSLSEEEQAATEQAEAFSLLQFLPLIGQFSQMLTPEKPPSELDVFPIADLDADSIDDIFTYAYEGKKDLIQQFCLQYQGLKNYTDSRGYTFTNFAILGYIQGNDSWATFKYLLENPVPLSDEFSKWLKESLDDKEKDARRRQICLILNARKSFQATDEDPFYSVPAQPPVVPVEQEPVSLLSSVSQVTGFALLGTVAGFMHMTGLLNKR